MVYFLLKTLTELGVIEPKMRDGRMINIKFRYKINEKKEGLLKFRDSLLLLPDSLRDLAESFGVESKSFCPYEFVNNPNVDLSYVGPIPSYDLWKDISRFEFDNLNQENWSLREQTIKYCIQDCITLHQILMEFNALVFKNWKLNISKFPTIASLALAIFKSNFLKKNIIPKLNGQIALDIRNAFTGGRIDSIRPYSENQQQYDVNSLYPYIMANKEIPVGPIKYFEGDILKRVAL